MILLAIDPGYRESHAVLYASGDRVNGPREVRRCWSLPNEEMLENLRGRHDGMLADLVLIESMDPFGLRLGRETMDTILWIGRFMEAGRAELVPRSLIKMMLCGTRRADDASIRRVLIDRLGAPGTAKSPGATYGVSGHRWQALAVAVTWLEVNGGGEALRTPPVCTVEDFTAASSVPTPTSNPAPASTPPAGADNRTLFEEER